MKEKLRTGVIGTGNISRVHLDWMKTRDDVDIAALCDIDEKALETKRAVYGGSPYPEMSQMLENEKLDAVWICTPQTVRKEPLERCADLGIPTFCEKPAAVDDANAQDISRSLATRAANVMIGYPFRALPIVEELRASWQDDKIHTVQSAYLCDVSLTMGLPGWFYNIEESGGAMVDQATHVFDLLRTLLGEITTVIGIGANPVRRKRKGYTIDETIGIVMEYESGAIGTHSHSWVADTWKTEVLFSGEKRLYRLELTDGSLTVTENGQSRRTTYDRGLYTYENDRFIEMVHSGKWDNNPCSYEDAARSLSLTLRCNEVIKS